MARPLLDELIRQVALLPPGPEAWAPIFTAYPEVTPEQLAEKFREAAGRDLREANELRATKTSRRRNVVPFQ
jgi:hypothetical protein